MNTDFLELSILARAQAETLRATMDKYLDQLPMGSIRDKASNLRISLEAFNPNRIMEEPENS
jgi:hypothetical protein